MKSIKTIIILLILSVFLPGSNFVARSEAIELGGQISLLKAQVRQILSQTEEVAEDTGMKVTKQIISLEFLEGEDKGEELTLENDFIVLREGDKVILSLFVDDDGSKIYSVRDVDRSWVLLIFLALFVGVIIIFSGKQGIRSLFSLAGSFFIIFYILLPSLVNGYPPILTSVVLASVILSLAIFLTHGFNRESLVAFLGTVLAVVLTGILAYWGVEWGRLSGLSADESVYLDVSTKGALNFSGLLLGGIIIGVLGVLDDIAITQTVVVSEIYRSGESLSPWSAYRRALRIGKEHVGAMVNTLALAYTGASLPLLLLLTVNRTDSVANLINREIFATEIIRTIIGSIGLILAVPITTLLAVFILRRKDIDFPPTIK